MVGCGRTSTDDSSGWLRNTKLTLELAQAHLATAIGLPSRRFVGLPRSGATIEELSLALGAILAAY